MATRRKVSEIAKEMASETKPKKIIIESKNPSIIIINGKKFIMEREIYKKIDNVQHSDKVVYKEFDEDEYNYNINLIIDTIAERTAKKELIKQLIKNIDLHTLRRLAKRIESGKLIKKQHGCIGFKIGDAYLQLIE